MFVVRRGFFHSRERAAAGLCPSPPILIRYLSDHLAVWICFPLSHTAGSASVILHHFAKRRTTRYIPILSSVPFFPQRFYDRGKISGRNRTVDEIVDQPVLLHLTHLVRQLLFGVLIHDQIKATPHNSARAGGVGFFLSRKFGKQRNTWCISCFPNCADGGKDPPSGRRRFVRCCLNTILSCAFRAGRQWRWTTFGGGDAADRGTAVS